MKTNSLKIQSKNQILKSKQQNHRRQSKQLSFIKPQQKFFGGILLVGRRKTLRPLTSKDSIHFVLRSTWAMGPHSFLARRNRQVIERIIQKFAKKFGVRIYRQAINSNHLHLLLRITNRVLYRAFIRAVSGKIASHVMGQQSFKVFAKSRARIRAGDGSQANEDCSLDWNNSEKFTESFWQHRPFSRVVTWGQDFKSCSNYLLRNTLEAFGFIQYKPRKNYYARWVKDTIELTNLRFRNFELKNNS